MYNPTLYVSLSRNFFLSHLSASPSLSFLTSLLAVINWLEISVQCEHAMGLRSVCIGFRVEISVWFWCLGCWIWFGGFWRLGCWIWMVIWWRWWWWWVVSAAWVWFVNCGSNLWFMVMGLLVMFCWSWIVLLLLLLIFFFFLAARVCGCGWWADGGGGGSSCG